MAGENAALKEAALAKARGETSGTVDRVDHPACGVNRIADAGHGTVELLMPDGVTPRKKFALCGFASTSREMAPFADPEWALFSMNQLYRHIPRRCDLHFEIHKYWNEAVVPGTDHKAWLRDCGVPILMTAEDTEFPTAVRYPIERLIEKFNDYFTSTVAYMLAFTIDHIDRQVEARMKAAPSNGLANAWDVTALARSLYREYSIGIYGIDLVVGEEYTWQRPCAEYYLGQALARDITVHVPKPSALLKQRYRYGYQMEPDDLVKDSDISKRLDLLKKKHQELSEQLLQIVGSINETQYWQELRQLRERGADVG